MNFVKAINDFPIIITEGSVIERLKREYSIELDTHIANAGLIYDSIHNELLAGIYRQYINITCERNLPIILFTPTWRANFERLKKTQVFGKDVNLDCFKFLEGIRDEYEKYAENIFIGGLIGCQGDAYKAEEGLSTADAVKFHEYQIERLINAGVDFLIAETLPAISEALGIAKAMSASDKPYIIGFVIREDGTILDGTPLYKSINIIDAATELQPIGYVVNCVHPVTLKKALLNPINSPLKIERIIGLMGNTSTKSPEELDNASVLETEEPQIWAEHMIMLKEKLGIKILGGCCGTNNHHIQALVDKIASIK